MIGQWDFGGFSSLFHWAKTVSLVTNHRIFEVLFIINIMMLALEFTTNNNRNKPYFC